MVARQRLAVHLVGQEDVAPRVDCSAGRTTHEMEVMVNTEYNHKPKSQTSEELMLQKACRPPRSPIPQIERGVCGEERIFDLIFSLVQGLLDN